MRQRVVVNLHVELAVAALGVGQGLARDGEEVVLRQRLELEDAAAADQRLVDLEVGVLGGRADQDHRAVLDPRQQRVLLRLVEAVDLVHEEDGALAELAAALLRVGDGGADVGHAGQHRVDGDEVRPRGVGDDPRQRGLARARRPVEDHRAELVGLDGAAQQPARPHDVLLADELVQRARAHPRGERRFLLGQLLAAGVEKVGVGGFGHGDIVARRSREGNWGNLTADRTRPLTDHRARGRSHLSVVGNLRSVSILACYRYSNGKYNTSSRSATRMVTLAFT